MSQQQIMIAIVILVIVLVVMRTKMHVSLRQGLPGIMGDLAYGFERLRAGLSWRKVDIQDFTVVYLDNHAKKEIVFLLHGFSGEKDDWNAFIPHLKKKYRVIALDMPGSGETSRPAHAKYDPVSQARRLGAVKKKLGIIEKVNLVGIHTGAAAAGLYAGVAPAEVQSLVMIEPFGIDVPTKSEVETLAERGLSALSFGDESEFKRAQKLLFRNPPKRSGAIVNRRIARGRQSRGFDAQVWRDIWTNRPYLLQAVLPEIKVPTLVVWGDSNKVCHQSALPIVEAALPGVTTVQLRGTGHLMIQERAKDVANLVLRFLGGEKLSQSDRLEKTVVRLTPESQRAGERG